MNTTLFLDRDGVINNKMPDGDCVKSLAEFEFIDGVLEALNILRQKFQRIFVVTNQQGIAKGLLTEKVLFDIHNVMKMKIAEAGGGIDGVYYCPHLKWTCTCRKPKIGMALQAQKEFPEIVLEKSFMVGDTQADWDFGKNIGGYPFLLNDDFSLLDFAIMLETYHV